MTSAMVGAVESMQGPSVTIGNGATRQQLGALHHETGRKHWALLWPESLQAAEACGASALSRSGTRYELCSVQSLHDGLKQQQLKRKDLFVFPQQ